MRKTSYLPLIALIFLNHSAFAVDAQVELNAQNPSYTNTQTLNSGNGYDIWLNGQTAFTAQITNTGALKVSDNGYGIYYSPFMTRGTTLNLVNTGTIERIQLEEMDGWVQNHIGPDYMSNQNGLTILNGSNIYLNDQAPSDSADSSTQTGDTTQTDSSTQTGVTPTTDITPETDALIAGRVLLGTYATVRNFGGTFANLDLDEGQTKGNLISLASNGAFNNGVETVYAQVNDAYVLTDVIFHNSIVSTDHIQFAQTGTLTNGSLINNKSITLGDGGAIYNIGEAYDQTNPVLWGRENGATLISDRVVMGNNSYINNEMGTNFKTNLLNVGDKAVVTNGADYSLVYQNQVTITQSLASLAETYGTNNPNLLAQLLGFDDASKLYEMFGYDLSGTIEQTYVLPTIPHQAIMEAKEATFGNESALNVINNASYKGEELTFKDKGLLYAKGGEIIVGDENDANSGHIRFGDEGTINLLPKLQEAILTPTITSEGKVELTEIFPEALIKSGLTTGTLEMKDHGSLMAVDSDVKTAVMDFKDYANISISGLTQLSASQYISLGNHAFFLADASVSAPLVTFKDDGQLFIGNQFDGDVLNMGKRSYIEVGIGGVSGVLTSKTTVDSDSRALLTSPEAEFSFEADDGSTRLYRLGSAITGGFSKADGATNVTIESATKPGYYGYLSGGVNVDNILISSSDLRVSDDVRGTIQLATDTALTFVGQNVYIHDPISKLQDATNTTVEVMLDHDSFYTTTSDITVDHIKLLSGGMTVTRPINVGDITFSSDTTLRLKGNFVVGDLVELQNDASNTTLAIDGGQGNSIDSSGKIVLDRIVVESGAFNVLHEIDARYSDSASHMPTAYEEGIELGSDTTLNVYADVSVNRIVRNQDVISKGQDVENTTLNLNTGHLTVERNIDIDTLNLNRGTLELQNKDTYNAGNVTHNLTVGEHAILVAQGLLNVKEGNLDVENKGRLAVSTRPIEENPISELKIISSQQTITDTTQPYNSSQNVVVNFDKGSVLDLRANEDKNDKVTVAGTVNIADGTRVVVRNIETNQEYELLSATQLNGNMDKIKTSFLWTGRTLTNNNNSMILKITGLQTLNEGIASASPSQNVNNIAQALTSIRESIGAYTIDPFVDEVFFASTANEAVQVMNEYSPEGYLNVQQNTARLHRSFKNSAMSELDTIRAYKQRPVQQQYGVNYSTYVPNRAYFGRPGYERYYANYNAMARTRSNIARTDSGGVWAKPFMVSLTQDKKDNMSGYDFDATGITAGIDKRFGSVSLGLMAMYATSDMQQTNKVFKSDMTTYGAGIYGSIMPRATKGFVDFYALWSQTSNKGKHSIASLAESAKADFDVTTYSMGADWGYDMKVSKYLTITPKVGVDYTSVKSDKITEKGNFVGLTEMEIDDYTSIQTPVELKASFDFGNSVTRLRPEGHVRWAHEFGDTQTSGKARFVNYAQPYAVKGVNADEDVVTVGGSLLWLYRASELEVSYDYDYSSSATGHSLNVGYKYLF